jgi:hypothetical protein
MSPGGQFLVPFDKCGRCTGRVNIFLGLKDTNAHLLRLPKIICPVRLIEQTTTTRDVVDCQIDVRKFEDPAPGLAVNVISNDLLHTRILALPLSR